MSELISIITPMYNSEKFIESTIQSVRNQTYVNWEMIIVDDASTDRSESIVRKIMRKDDRIKLMSLNKRKGSANARNNAIRSSRGRYLAFLDSDDIWLTEKLSRQVKFMKEGDYLLSFTAYQKIDEESNVIGKVDIGRKEVSYKELLRTNYIGCLTVIIDVKLIGRKVFMPLIEKRHDHALWLEILKDGHHAFGLNEILAQYRYRKDSLSHNKLNALRYQWYLYRDIENMNLLQSLIYMLSYSYLGFRKWRE